MIHKCRNCGTAVVFNPASQRLDCPNCSSSFLPSEFYGVPDESADSATSEHMMSKAEAEKLECKIYCCNACGAELVINDAEAATFCAYCGQPSIVFQRVDIGQRPKRLIPFSVTKGQAINIIKNSFTAGKYIPKEIKDFNVEKVRGVYIPFWLYDVYYKDNMFWSGEVGSGDDKETRYYIREADAYLNQITQDASKNLLDESSQRLEPYDLGRLVSFDSGYLSGFYADRFDEDDSVLSERVKARAKEIFEAEVENSIKASSKRIVYADPHCEVKGTEYVLLPAWFFSFVYQGVKYTMLVNGQTGKLVGTVPYDKKMAKRTFTKLAVILSLVMIPISYLLVYFAFDDSDYWIGILAALALCIFGALAKKHQIEKTMEYTASETNERFANNRQDV